MTHFCSISKFWAGHLKPHTLHSSLSFLKILKSWRPAAGGRLGLLGERSVAVSHHPSVSQTTAGRTIRERDGAKVKNKAARGLAAAFQGSWSIGAEILRGSSGFRPYFRGREWERLKTKF